MKGFVYPFANQKALIPFSDVISPVGLSDRVSITNGGSIKNRNIAVINIAFTSNYTASNRPSIINTNLTLPYLQTLNCTEYHTIEDAPYPDNNVPATISPNGVISIKEITTDNLYLITGTVFID